VFSWVQEEEATNCYNVASVAALLVRRFGGQRASQIDQAFVEKDKRDRLESRRKASPVLKDLTTLQAIFHWGIEQGIITVNPVAEVKFPRENTRHIRLLTAEEEARLLIACNATLRPVVHPAHRASQERATRASVA
jgi:site-specific recombinase XerC